MTTTTTTGKALWMLNSVMIERATADRTNGPRGFAFAPGIEILLPA